MSGTAGMAGDQLEASAGYSSARATYRLERKSVTGDTLSLHSPHERNVTREDTDPRQGSKDGHSGHKVVENDQGVTGSDEVGETHE
jgi:hypothetical protein